MRSNWGFKLEGKYVSYEFLKSFGRIEDKISSSDNSFPERDEIPLRTDLTFSNGYYVNCTALYIDIRNSSDLPNYHTRPKLAKLYRAYISEVIAVIGGNSNCAEVIVEGDCVVGIFNTPNKPDIDSVFSTAARLASLIDVMNCKFDKYEIKNITVGIGIHYGRALMIKAGFRGSGINDVVWMGDVLNEASRLCSFGNNESSDKEIMVSSVIYNNLNEHNQKLLEKNRSRDCYHGNVISTSMNEWYEENC